MHIDTQFSIFLINKPGVLAQVLNALADGKVNIIAMTLMDSGEHGVLRLVSAQPAHARGILKRISMQVTESEVLCVTLPNKPGALADIATQLSQEHININYCYVTAGAHGGKTTGVLKVEDLKKTMKILEKHTCKKKSIPQRLRPNPSQKAR
ncbi:MAG: ACT domain-containing protein [Sedimentisphaerales bacterium]|nr:ACT domain-containing protein [Sedimentisphaerales bacterium]